METRRLLLAFVLSLAVIAIWYALFPPAKPKPPEPLPAQRQKAAPSPAPLPGAPTPAAAPGTAGAPASPAPAVSAAPPVQAAAEEAVTLQAGRARAVFNNRGAQLTSLLAPELSNPKSGTLELVRQRAGVPYPYALTAGDGLQPSPLNQALFQVQRGADGRSVTFRVVRGGSPGLIRSGPLCEAQLWRKTVASSEGPHGRRHRSERGHRPGDGGRASRDGGPCRARATTRA